MSNLILLPNGQRIRPENEVMQLRRALTQQTNEHRSRLLQQEIQLKKLDDIMNSAFQKIDIYEEKLKELGINLEELINERRKEEHSSQA